MKYAVRSLLLIALIAGVVPSCTRSSSDAAPDRHEGGTPARAAPMTDDWVGRWNGPEGTYLQIDGGNGSYEVTVKDLDRARSFKGLAVGNRIEFERDGTKESLRATNGKDTGMKWLDGKANCLTVKPGEGYCRD